MASRVDEITRRFSDLSSEELRELNGHLIRAITKQGLFSHTSEITVSQEDTRKFPYAPDVDVYGATLTFHLDIPGHEITNSLVKDFDREEAGHQYTKRLRGMLESYGIPIDAIKYPTGEGNSIEVRIGPAEATIKQKLEQAVRAMNAELEQYKPGPKR